MTITLTGMLSSDLKIADGVAYDLVGPFETEDAGRHAQLLDTSAPKGDQWLGDYSGGWRYDRLSLADAAAIHLLARSGDLHAFEKASVQLHFGMPIGIATCWPGYTGGTFPESVLIHHPRKWGDGVTRIFEDKPIDNLVSAHFQSCIRLFNGLMKAGVPSSEAQLVLPQATVVEFFEVRSLLSYAQLVRGPYDRCFEPYVNLINLLLADAFPIAWQALTETNQ